MHVRFLKGLAKWEPEDREKEFGRICKGEGVEGRGKTGSGRDEELGREMGMNTRR